MAAGKILDYRVRVFQIAENPEMFISESEPSPNPEFRVRDGINSCLTRMDSRMKTFRGTRRSSMPLTTVALQMALTFPGVLPWILN